ncbi:hypothetical protein QJQ45_001798 [Haematococcus lacustris]|nr:hypothetical protein QJQ45_001798 [Haematococcus lacustris]
MQQSQSIEPSNCTGEDEARERLEADKRKAIQAAFVPEKAAFRSQHVIWYTTAPSNSNYDHYCAHGPNIIAASQLHPSLMPDLGLLMATITSSKRLAIVGVVAKHLQNMRHEMEQQKLELMGPKWNRDEALALGALAKACSSSSSSTPQWLLPLALPLPCSYRSPTGALAKASSSSSTLVAPAPALGPAPALQLHQLFQQQLLQPCPAVPPTLQQQQQHLESGRSHLSVEEVASMGQGQVEKRAKAALAVHAQDKSNIMNNDALVTFLHHMQVLELEVTNTVYKQVYSAVNGQG